MSTFPGSRWRPLIVAALVATTLLLGGCVYLRLLQLKNQLADFDRYFSADLRDGVKLTLNKPVLLDEDMTFFKLVPEKRERVGSAERWNFRWVKANASAGEDPAHYEVTADFIFSGHKLSKVILPERLFAFIPKPLFIGLLRSLGNAKIDREKRTASSNYNGSPATNPVAQMAQGEVASMLGTPFETKESAEGLMLRYRYRKATPDQRSGSIDVTFVINPIDQKVRRLKGRIFDATIDFTFGGPPSATVAPVTPPP